MLAIVFVLEIFPFLCAYKVRSPASAPSQSYLRRCSLDTSVQLLMCSHQERAIDFWSPYANPSPCSKASIFTSHLCTTFPKPGSSTLQDCARQTYFLPRFGSWTHTSGAKRAGGLALRSAWLRANALRICRRPDTLCTVLLESLGIYPPWSSTTAPRSSARTHWARYQDDACVYACSGFKLAVRASHSAHDPLLFL